MSLPCQVCDLIPQKGKMGFNQTLIKTKRDDSQSVAVIRDDHIFLNDHRQLSNIALVEYINQLIAAVQGYNEQNGKVHQGLFVGLQEAEFYRTVHQGESITLKRIITEEVPPVTFVRGIVERDGERIADFITKIYEVNDFSDLHLESQSIITIDETSGNNGRPPIFLDSPLHRQLYSYLRGFQTGDDFISFNIACPNEFEAFNGHFPGQPILPGVILLEIANLALNLFICKPVVLKSIKKM